MKTEKAGTLDEPVVLPAERVGSTNGATAAAGEGEHASGSQPAAAPAPAPARRRRWLRTAATLTALAVVLAAAVAFGWPAFRTHVLDRMNNNQAALSVVERRVDDAERRLNELSASIKAQEGALQRIDGDVSDVGGRVDAVERAVAASTSRLEALDARLASTDSSLQARVNVVKAMELLSRGRLFLYQANYGLAEQDVQSARQILVAVQGTKSPLATALDETLRRLDAVAANLPERPVLASDDLDIAWRTLLEGLPGDAAVTSSTAGTPTTASSATGSSTPATTTTSPASTTSSPTSSPTETTVPAG